MTDSTLRLSGHRSWSSGDFARVPDCALDRAATQATFRAARRDTWLRDAGTLLALAVLIGGIVALVSALPIGSGDYGQWLLASRHFTGEPEPAYRTLSELPPLVPALLAAIRLLVGDPILALRVLDAGLVAALALGIFSAAAALSRSRLAGLLALILVFYVSDLVTGLFAFGGLLEAASIASTAFAVAAFVEASERGSRGESRLAALLWVVGALAVGLAGSAHLVFGAMGIATGVGIALASALRMRAPCRTRVAALLPPGVVVAAVGAWWVVTLLPGSGVYAANPASIDYRGPDRLIEALAADPQALVVIGAGVLVVALAALGWVARRRFEPLLLAGSWALVSVGVLAAAIVTGASTDYLRFDVPILVPLAVATAVGLTRGAAAASRSLGALRRMPRALPLSLAGCLCAATAPVALAGYATEAAGYEVRSMTDLRAAASWIDANLPADATVLAAPQEGKWIEGLTGRAALFANPVRYSYRPAEWLRSLEARALLGSDGTLSSPDFLVRVTGDSAGTVIAANHGGELVDLLRLPAPTRADTLLLTSTASEARALLSYASQAGTEGVRIDQVISVGDGSSMQVVLTTAAGDPSLDLELLPAAAPGASVPIVSTFTALSDHEAELRFIRIGSSEPRLRIAVEGDGAAIEQASSEGAGGSGGVRVRAAGSRLQLTITDLTASRAAFAPVAALRPLEIASRRLVRAALLERDAADGEQATRLAALGLTRTIDFGPYVLLVEPERSAAP